MKVILLDDERLALNYLEQQLLEISGVEVICKFMDPHAAKEEIIKTEVDVVFLDINLPEINGLALAEMISEIKPKLHIVFVTAYDHYAVKAFELNAIDYVVKPIDSDRLSKTIQRINERNAAMRNIPSSKSHAIQMKLFQHVLIESPEGQFIPMHWRTTRAQEIFLYLLQHRGQLVRKSFLADMLWPDLAEDKVYPQLYTAIYHIRKNLEQYGDRFQISNTTEGYILDVEQVIFDAEQWEESFLSAPSISEKTINYYIELQDMYTGDYLQECDYWWVESVRHRLKLLWIRISVQMAEWYLSCNQLNKASEKYLEICERYPQGEESHFMLMKIYGSMNNQLSLNRQYRLLLTVLHEELNERPSAHITEWYNKWNESH